MVFWASCAGPGVAYRHENRIQHDTRNQRLGSLFNLSFASPKEAGPTTRNVHLNWRQKWPEGSVAVDLDACSHMSPDEVHLNITAHCSAGTGALYELDSMVRTAHRLARLTFEELITPRFREQLRTTHQHVKEG